MRRLDFLPVESKCLQRKGTVFVVFILFSIFASVFLLLL